MMNAFEKETLELIEEAEKRVKAAKRLVVLQTRRLKAAKMTLKIYGKKQEHIAAALKVANNVRSG